MISRLLTAGPTRVPCWMALCVCVCQIPLAAQTSVSKSPQELPKSAAGAANHANVEWPVWGGSASRNNVNPTTGVTLDFKPAKTPADGRNLLWVSDLGSHTYGNPIVAGGRIFVATNNGNEYRENHKGDRGVLLCFEEKSGKFLWQLTREKLESGKANDWPEQGICSTPCVEGNKLYVVTNRCEIMCLDCQGFYDKRNDGAVTDEVDAAMEDADILWSVDMISDYQVYPHNMATCSPVIHGDLLYVMTSNGIDEAHEKVPSPNAPSLLVLNKSTGEVVWKTSLPGTGSKAPKPWDSILHGQWSSPAIGVVGGRAQVYLPGGDGVLYALDAVSGELIWWFDLNPKDASFEMAGRGTRNEVIATPVFVQDSVILSTGQDPEHGEGEGYIHRIDATRNGDVSAVVEDGKGGWIPNPNSGRIWSFGGRDAEGTITGEKGGLLYRRTICTAVVYDGLVYCPDLSGFLHCLDLKTGQRYWEYDTFAAVWGSPVIVDGSLLLGDEDGEMLVMKTGKQLDEKSIRTVRFRSSIYSAPSIANGMLYVTDRSKLYAFTLFPKKP